MIKTISRSDASTMTLETNDKNGGGRVNRRQFIALAGGVAAAALVPQLRANDVGGPQPTLALVSRHLQWTDWRDGIKVAQEAGYSGIAWTVRPGAHIEPANVLTELPVVVEATRSEGLSVPMIITQIGSVEAQYIEDILSTLSSLGITEYRAGAPRYDYSRPFAEQYTAMTRNLAQLAALNERYGTRALFHTHSNPGSVGGSGWDLWMLMKDLDPKHIGINFDIGHITARNGNGWRDIAHAARAHIGALSLKDLKWARTDRQSNAEWPWEREFLPPGEGMVDFPNVFKFFQETEFTGPVEVYHEYMAPIPGSSRLFNMLGRNYGDWHLEVPREHFVALLKRDVDFYRTTAHSAGFRI